MKEIPLSRGFVATVDDEDYEWLSHFTWWADKDGYALTTVGGRQNHRNIRMHRMILDAPEGTVVDHVDGCPWNNQRHNLRITTQANNIKNRSRTHGVSKYKGVTWYAAYGKWMSNVTCDGVRYFLGYYDVEEDAAYVYNQKAKDLFGEYSYLNVLPYDYEPLVKQPRSRSCFRGVQPTPSGKWVSKFRYRNVTHHLGTFATAVEAARAYNAKAAEVLGKRARLNDIPDEGDEAI